MRHTGNWTPESYQDAIKKARAVLEDARHGIFPRYGEYDRFVVWGQNEQWLEIPAQILDDVIKGYDDVIKEVDPFEVGYHFYESAFIRIK